MSDRLPIEAALPALLEALQQQGQAVLVAPPGAGKTTLVPLALLQAPWRGDGSILVLEPRRIAARGAAMRMAGLLGERLGERVGLRARFDSQISARTRVLVVTEGVFTRMILDDPGLSAVAAVLFDEFHERSLDADFGLALALEARAALRPDLRLVVMSATLDDARIAAHLTAGTDSGAAAQVIRAEGRSFPVETRYRRRDPRLRIEQEVANAICAALASEEGSLLAFLPGQGQIERCLHLLEAAKLPENIDLCPLYGALPPERQDAAIRPAAPGRRKVVLATSIAETSLTIEGVRIVVDSGLARVPRFEPDLGLSRLETQRVSRASADQRRGRAGRMAPGIAIRLWDEAQDAGLRPFGRPEILDADLSGLRLDAALWGVNSLADLRLIDPAPAPAIKEAEALLLGLHAIDARGRITEHGRTLQKLALMPRLAALVLAGAEHGQAGEAAELAALIGERGVGGHDVDLHARLERLGRERSTRAQGIRALAARWARLARAEAIKPPLSCGGLLALAFPDRIAKARGQGAFHLANGRMAALEPEEPLAAADYLVIADMTGSSARARITAAAAISRAEIDLLFAGDIRREEDISFASASGALRARRLTRLGALTLESTTLPLQAGEAIALALARAAAKQGTDRLAWSKSQLQLRDRVNFLRATAAAAQAAAWPDLSDSALAQGVELWLAPFLHDATSLAAIDAALLGAALDALLPFALRARLEGEAPTHFIAPTGNSHAIRYRGEGAPFLAIRVQELFGLKTHPALAGGRLPLTLELLSPAQRPIQITRDLPRFWAGSWAEVRAELRGRYPRHPWPEDPANAAPTARARPRGS